MIAFSKEDLSEDNILLVAAKNYRNTRRSYIEFREDLRRIHKIRSIISRRANQIEKSEEFQNDKINRKLLNLIIIFFNIFSIDFAKAYLFHSIDESYHHTLKTILIFLSFMKEDEMIEVPLDSNMVKFIREQI
jgi:hypothetical protein